LVNPTVETMLAAEGTPSLAATKVLTSLHYRRISALLETGF